MFLSLYIILHRDGQTRGHAEGRATGMSQGFRVGYEVGFFAGCLEEWRRADGATLRPGPRALHNMRLLESLVQSFPWDNPEV